MADFETKLRWLSERGNPVGAEELIERIKADLAGDPLVVVAKRREGALMTKTQQRPTNRQTNRYRGPAWGVAAFVAILAVAGLYFAFADNTDEVADNPPPPTTVAPDVETMTDLEVIEAGVEALYSGDSERAVGLFDLWGPHDDNWIREWAAYEEALGGQLTLDCTEQGAPGVFACIQAYNNVFADAIGIIDETPGDDPVRVVVEAGVITEFDRVCEPITVTCGEDRGIGFQSHWFIEEGLAEYLKDSGYGNTDCVQRSDDGWTIQDWHHPLAPSIRCLQDVRDDLDGWAAWAETNLELP